VSILETTMIAMWRVAELSLECTVNDPVISTCTILFLMHGIVLSYCAV
jgi:hypothetical protein